MSMISAQADKLRKAAQTYRNLGNYETEQVLLNAADTISELRGALLVAAKEHRELEAENAKLRELAAQMGEMLDCVICDRRVGCNWQDDGPCWYEIELRKLGVEVDG